MFIEENINMYANIVDDCLIKLQYDDMIMHVLSVKM